MFSTHIGRALGAAILLVLLPLLGCGAQSAGTRSGAGPRDLEQSAPSSAYDADTLFLFQPLLERDDLVRAVLARNRSLEAERQAWAAALGRASREGAWPDPEASYELAPLSVGGDVPYGQRIQVEQAIPLWGRRGLARQAALAEADMARGDYRGARLRLVAQTSNLFDDYYLVHRAIQITQAHQTLLRELKAGVLGRYEAGLATQAEPLKADVELAHMEHQQADLEMQRALIRAELNALLHLAPSRRLPPPPDSLAAPDLDVEPADSSRVAALALRPEVEASDSAVRAREADERLAGRLALPDLRVMGAYDSMWDDEEHRWMVGIGVDLPLWGGGRSGARAAAAAGVERALREREALEDEILLDVEKARRRLALSSHVVSLYRDRVIPAARDQLAASRSAYEAGRLGFLEIIEAERTLRDAEYVLEEAVSGAYRNRTELARATGRLDVWADRREGDMP